MRQKRAKTYRKLLASYIRHFGLRPPLQVLIDAPMATALANMKMAPDEVATRLESVLQVSAALPSGSRPQSMSATAARAKAALVKPMITQCCITELYNGQKRDETGARAVELAKSWERRFCNHKSPIAGDQCMADVVGETNKHHYVLAANSPGLRGRIRRAVAGVAIVHTNDHHVLVMEPMSDLTRAKCKELEQQKLMAAGLRPVKRAVEESDGDEEGDEASGAEHDGRGAIASLEEAASQVPRKRKVKGPNPLSVKKPKKERSSMNGAGINAPAGRSGAARRKKKKAREQAAAAGFAV